jgi:hypothetical protein
MENPVCKNNVQYVGLDVFMGKTDPERRHVRGYRQSTIVL